MKPSAAIIHTHKIVFSAHLHLHYYATRIHIRNTYYYWPVPTQQGSTALQPVVTVHSSVLSPQHLSSSYRCQGNLYSDNKPGSRPGRIPSYPRCVDDCSTLPLTSQSLRRWSLGIPTTSMKGTVCSRSQANHAAPTWAQTQDILQL